MTIVMDTFAKIGFMFALIMGMVVVLIWMERKGAAFIQDRTGPNRADILGIRLAGLVHPVADVFKLLFKEDIQPANRHKALYNTAPWLVMVIAMSTYAVIPFGDYLTVGGRQVPLIVADLNVGLLYILAVASLGTYGVVMAGWAANNKFTFLGGIRATAQMISYEISMGLALMGLILVYSGQATPEHLKDFFGGRFPERPAHQPSGRGAGRVALGDHSPSGASSCSPWGSSCSWRPPMPRPTATPSTCPRASRKSWPASTWNTAP